MNRGSSAMMGQIVVYRIDKWMNFDYFRFFNLCLLKNTLWTSMFALDLLLLSSFWFDVPHCAAEHGKLFHLINGIAHNLLWIGPSVHSFYPWVWFGFWSVLYSVIQYYFFSARHIFSLFDDVAPQLIRLLARSPVLCFYCWPRPSSAIHSGQIWSTQC